MRQLLKTALALASAAFLMTSLSYGQSLGDVARQTRQKQQFKDGHATAKKVVTNEDIPDHSSDGTEPAPTTASEGASVGTSSAGTAGGTKSAEDWKSEIKAQKDAIANYQQQIDKLNESIHYVQANLYTNGVQYNQYQAKKQAEVEQAQRVLAEQKKKLEDMQEAAHKAGFGSAVYDP
jgi:predicted RNase H-like nuclease (RuvC/YqgF family)